MPARLLDRVEGQMHLAQLQMKSLLADLSIESPFQLLTLDPAEEGGPSQVAIELRSYWRIPPGPISNLVQASSRQREAL